MSQVTLLCFRSQVTVWLEKHSDQKSQVMATLQMAKFGLCTTAWEGVPFNTTASTSQQTGFNRLSVVETSNSQTKSASGVTDNTMDQ